MINSPITIAIFDATVADKKFFKACFNKQQFKVSVFSEPIHEIAELEYSKYDIVSVRVTSKLSGEIIQKFSKLKLIAVRATGFDKVDIAVAKAKGILVATVPGYGENTVAEYAFGLMLNLIRKIQASKEQLQSGEIDHTKLTGFELFGKTLGVVGTGKIGAHVVRVANGFGMKVKAFDPFPNQQLEFEYNMEYVNLPKLCMESDIITLHAPYTHDNHHLINAKLFSKMKNGAILINTARGELVDTKALVAVLVSKKLGGAALDVVEGEALFSLHEDELMMHKFDKSNCSFVVEQLILEKLGNVLLSPHNAFNTVEALDKINQVTRENITGFLAGRVQNIVSI